MTQSAFHTALLAPDAPVPPGLTDPKGRPAGRRFDVYRNNVVVSLSEALAEAFPTVRSLVGEEFFTATAGVFVRAHPPRDPRLATWGAEFPAFLAGFPPAANLLYLPDVARLDQALRESYHAADAAPAPPEALARITENSRLTLAPALRLVASPYPIHAIRAHARGAGPKPKPGAEAVLITRPEYDPKLTLLEPGAEPFLAALLTGAPFGTAIEAAPEGFDSTATLTALISGQAITEVAP